MTPIPELSPETRLRVIAEQNAKQAARDKAEKKARKEYAENLKLAAEFGGVVCWEK